MGIAFLDKNFESGIQDKIKPAKDLALLQKDTRRLSSTVPVLAEALEGGLSFQALHEWGVPPGSQGREVVLSFLTQFHGPLLWAYSDAELSVYPPAWHQRGMNLNDIFFIQSERPAEQIKPAFLSPTFKVLVLDNPKCSSADLAFLHKQAIANHQLIFILRNYFLTARNGNIWAKNRLNSWYEHRPDQFHVQAVKSASKFHVHFRMRWSRG